MGAIQDALSGFYLTAGARILEALLATAGLIAGVSAGLSLAGPLGVSLIGVRPGRRCRLRRRAARPRRRDRRGVRVRGSPATRRSRSLPAIGDEHPARPPRLPEHPGPRAVDAVGGRLCGGRDRPGQLHDRRPGRRTPARRGRPGPRPDAARPADLPRAEPDVRRRHPGHPAAHRRGGHHDRAGRGRDPGGVHRAAAEAERTPPRESPRRSADGRCHARTPRRAGGARESESARSCRREAD